MKQNQLQGPERRLLMELAPWCLLTLHCFYQKPHNLLIYLFIYRTDEPKLLSLWFWPYDVTFRAISGFISTKVKQSFSKGKKWGDINQDQGRGAWYPCCLLRDYLLSGAAVVFFLTQYHATAPKFTWLLIPCICTGREVGYCNWQDASDSLDYRK